MTFNYTNNIPLGNNNPSVDQPNMQTNTNSISSIIAVDHVGFNATNGGTHKQVTLTNESTPAIPAGTNGVLYANAVSGLSWPFWNNGTANYQLAGISSAAANNGYVFLPAGIILKWGSVTGLSGAWPTTPQTLSFSPAFPTACFTVYTTFIGPTSSSTGDITINSITGGTSFTWQFSGAAGSSFGGFYWLAIGN